mgnify:CR=1 FL=1
MEKAYLVFENGRIFEGYSIGAKRNTIGEAVFTTGMVGYLETLTDPSYAGQIVIQTFPQIGNYGVIPEDFEGDPAVRGYVVRDCCDAPSNFRSKYALDQYLKEKNIPGICGIDTRAVTRMLRTSGVMNASICDAPPQNTADIAAYCVKDAVSKVSTKSKKEYPSDGAEAFHVALIDYGAKRNIIRSLCARGCSVTVFPQDSSAEEILKCQPDGIMLSNGPGDPAENIFCIEQIKKLIGRLPVFGICLGHQLAALAMGAKTQKLKYGHRGANQPVKDLLHNRTYITSQNHGYAVINESLKGIGTVTMINANDQSCEGVEYPGKQCFTVQFHPEACSGPQDTSFLFDRFIAMMGGAENAEKPQYS